MKMFSLVRAAAPLFVFVVGACDGQGLSSLPDAAFGDSNGADVAVADASADAAADAAAGDDVVPNVHPALVGTRSADFTVRPGVEIATVFGATPGRAYTLYDATGARRLSVIADDFGHAHFSYLPFAHETIDPGNPDNPEAGITGDFVRRARVVPPGDGWVVRDDAADPPEAFRPFRVLAVGDVPDPALFDRQVLNGVFFGIFGHDGDPHDGLNYIEMRDGVHLSAMVRFPDPGIWGDGPWPTVIEYSGYAPSQPDAPDPGSRIATLLGFATVGVNMRGTGCSGGVFDIFSPAQQADAYDIIEAVARQEWVLHGHVGMVGLSYPGISQVYAAATRPPSLAAIAPLSIFSDPWEMLRPGGIYNAGFTRQWLDERDREASPNGQSWTDERIALGDTVCAEHQELRNQNLDFGSIFEALDFYPDVAYPRSVKRLVRDIEVPVYLSGGFQDEQTGPQFADILNHFEKSQHARFVLYNGRHVDGYSPLTLARWWEFLELFVAKRVPRMPDWMRELGAAEFSREYGSEGLAFEADRFSSFAADDYAGVLEAWSREPPVRVLFESGGFTDQPGAPEARFAMDVARWPPPDAWTSELFLQPSGALEDIAPATDDEATWAHDPQAGRKTFFGPRGYQTMPRLWDIAWTRFDPEHVAAWETDVLAEPWILAGPGWLELHVVTPASDLHVQVTLTEIRTDGNEALIQSGWLRAGHGTIDEDFTDGNALHYTWREEDFAPITPGQATLMRIPIPSVAHALRAGSRLRVAVSSPGRNHGTWQFPEPLDTQGPQRLLMGPATASKLVLTRIDGTETGDGLAIPEAPPACPGLRGQPCRPVERLVPPRGR
jgi:predicted acyl esterase